MTSTTNVFISLFIMWYTFPADGQKCVLNDDKRSIEKKLKDDLLCNYDKFERPVKDHTTVVTVTVTMIVKQIFFSVEQASESPIFMAFSWTAMSWNDEYLRWSPGEYSDIRQIQIASTSIWLPRLVQYHGSHVDNSYGSDGDFDSLCLLQMTGDVVCIPDLIHAAVCYPNLEAWPFDKQNCTLQLGSLAQTDEEINFLLNETDAVNISEYSPNLQWDLLSVDAVRKPAVKLDQTPMLIYTFNMRRHNSHQIAIIIWPAIVMIVLTLTSILIEINKIERVIILSLNLICHFFEMQHLYEETPAGGKNTPGVLFFFRDSMIITAFILTFTVGLKCISKFQSEMPEWLPGNFIMESMPGKIIMFNEFDPTAADATVNNDEDIGQPQAIRVKNKKKWWRAALFINRVSFVVIFVVYVLLVIALIP